MLWLAVCFKARLLSQDWNAIFNATDSDSKAEKYQEVVCNLMNECYPLVTVRKKSSDDPWITDKIRKKIKQRKKIFKKQGRSKAWKKLKKITIKMIKYRREKYMEKHKILITSPGASALFYRNVRSYNTPEKPKIWNIKSVKPELSDGELALQLSKFFNEISSEFEPLDQSEIPRTYARQLPLLKTYQVAMRIKRIKKPRTRIQGDVFPNLMSEFADSFAVPLTNIYNCITESFKWPACWKTEIVTVIPKCANPLTFDQLRNISCTLLVSKIYESFLLLWAREEITLRDNQYGGERGCSTDHYLLEAWEIILRDLEDDRAGSVLTSIDFAKGFNRVSHQYCLQAFAEHGSSTDIIRLLATFLQGRRMKVRVNTTFSDALPVNGGCPQGSLLGVFLFNVSTDNVEQSREGKLEELGEQEIHVGDFFDAVDREYLRSTEGVEITLNAESELLPSVNFESSECEYSDANVDANVFFTSKPRSDSPPDIFINGCLLYTSPSPRD